MPRPILYVAITSHGFGHTVRAASVVAAAQRLNPDLLPIFVCTTPRWLLESYVSGEFIHRPRAYDVGVVQADSLQMDLPATRSRVEDIRTRQQAIITSEADYIRTNRAGLVLADIPPLAAPIAKAAGVPCWMMGNFGWDFIYRAWGEGYSDLADWIGDCYQQCDLLFRLPMSESMSAFSKHSRRGANQQPAKLLRYRAAGAPGPCRSFGKNRFAEFWGIGLTKNPLQKPRSLPRLAIY